MPSLFSRTRTNSTPKKSSSVPAFDEFGRIGGRGTPSPVPTGKKDKKKDKARAKAASQIELDSPELVIPDGIFLPLNLELPRFEPTTDPPVQEQEQPQPHDYGYLSYGRHVVLGLEQMARLVDVVGNELGQRGLTTPFIFSTLALDVSSNAVKRLIKTFLRTCSKPSSEADRQWREEARLAGPHELGMCLRWGLARVVRIMKGQEVRGLVSYESYVEWRDAEAALKYPETHFQAFIAPLPSLLRSILVGLFTLLSRFTAHSASSGHTPPTLSSLFGPLLFGLGPSTLAFHQAYVYYLRATTATEHLILSFIRWQDVPPTSVGVGASGAPFIGIPTRLKAWIQGYPSMLPATGKPDRRPEPRRGARTVRVMSVRRNVRMYSPDLVKTAASWAQRPRGAGSSMGERAFAGSKEWDRIAPSTLKLSPRYSDAYRKRMDLPPNFHPDSGAGSASSSINAPSLTSSVSTASSTLFDEKDHGILGARTGEDRFRSLTDLKWGEFEVMGFGDLGADDKKLQFDLTEGARAARAAKRATLTWQDFSSTGFSRTDDPLKATLEFSTPITTTVNSWPAHSVEIHRKLKKTQKSLPAFGWDTEPVLGPEEVIEEAFVDVFCDLVYGGGWMDIERCEEVDRECNWALVEFKSLPINKTATVPGKSDPRTSTTLMLFEEFVPLEYRQQLAEYGRTRRKLPRLFGTTSKSKQWKPAPTLNGRPYVIGHVPNSPSYRELEFEGLLRESGSATKILSLTRSQAPGRDSPAQSDITTPSQAFHTPAINGSLRSPPPLRLDIKSANSPTPRPPKPQNADSPVPLQRRNSRFRLPVSPGGNRRSMLIPAEYETVDFHARLASFSDEEIGDPTAGDKHNRRQSKDDAWVDILVANHNRRMNAQDAELRVQRLQGRRSDPEMASQEVSEVLAAVRATVLSDEDVMEPVDTPRDLDREFASDDYTTAGDSELTRDRTSYPDRDSALYGDDEGGEGHTPPVRTRRLGYFDLHPERRQVLLDSSNSNFPGNRSSFDSDALSQDDVVGTSDSRYVSGLVPGLRRDEMVSSTYSEGEGEFETTPSPSLVNVSDTSSISVEAKRPPYISTIPPPNANTVSQNATPSGSGSGSAVKPVASRTATLIEMYRERERTADSQNAPHAPASRLPVRSASLGLGAAASQIRPPPQAATPTAAVSETDESDVDSELYLEEPELNLPYRYVHGAPLHNVLEEPEEEDVD
ncbi:uncharacterized protein LAESUDRAFT_660514 [Laetiporus sulphureus 93-53]|uniref:Meiotically up-regulated protein Msb1/Mug8 domain-containing protein n=1 Tax=Laetiporus sulphureus 93-53 TaxID=1314785 RepID=A0A165CN26_9APHY|nr:uncharacterized protein LAESUDRAFT_660514 [Laetiporus sulphureus 93-53]KZT03110.1 hypothetical protein LAESUDRAFT_660514 [Laetiporus sulphureus 93-53]